MVHASELAMDMCVFVDGQNTSRISTTEEAAINDDEDNMTLQQMPDSCPMEDNIDDGAELSITAASTSGNSIEKVPVTGKCLYSSMQVARVLILLRFFRS